MKKSLFAFLAFVFAFTSISVDAQKKPNPEKNKTFIQVYTEDFWNKHNIDAFDKYYTDDFILHFASGDQNREQYKETCKAYFAAFPDMKISTDDLLAEGNKVVKVWTSNFTHESEFMGIPATGKPIVQKGIEVIRIEDGKIAEVWFCKDDLGVMKQLGIIPPMGE